MSSRLVVLLSLCGLSALICGCSSERRPAVNAILAERSTQSLEELLRTVPGGDQKPDRYWVGKTLEPLLNGSSAVPKDWRPYLAYPSKADALAAMIETHEQGFRDRMHTFSLQFIDFLPHDLYRYDPLARKSVPGIELAAFANVRASAEGVLRQGDFFSLYDFDLDALRFRYSPFSAEAKEQMAFMQDWLEKPFFRVLTNSLSNKNRKRAAWLLRSFLCDDLVTAAPAPAPDIEITAAADAPAPARLGSGVALISKQLAFHPSLDSSSSASRRHASEVGCKSCHWKLDYVGAFFRYFDSWGNNYQKRGKYLEFVSQVVYRDGSWDDWMSEWRRSDGRWAAGVRRASLEPHPRDWDATVSSPDPVPADLFSFLKRDPDAHRCLTKRMAEFFVGPNLSYDADWLTELSQRFSRHPIDRSGTAFLEVMGALLFSQAYAERNPDPDRCYDAAASGKTRKIPCGVFRILQSQCLSCHGDGSLRIDLNDLVDRPGTGPWLNHRDDHGNLLPVAESLRIFRERLETEDTELRMPYGKPPLSAGDRQKLVQWLERLQGGK